MIKVTNTGSLRILAGLALALLVYSCAGSEAMQGSDGNVYDAEYNRMIKVVEQAIRGRALNVEYAERSDNGNEYTVIFSKRISVNNNSVQQEQGEVHIRKLSENKTSIRIINPDYHFTVPTHQRTDYKRILTNRIKDILKG